MVSIGWLNTAGGISGKCSMNLGQKLKSKSWDIYWTFKYLIFALVFWLLLLSRRGQEHRFNPPNNDDDNDSDDNDNVL